MPARLDILTRADAETGVGHAMRCLALAEAASADFATGHLIGDALPEALADDFAALGYHPGMPAGEVLLVDLPRLPEKLPQATKTLLIDDGAHQSRAGVDLLLNPHPDAGMIDYSVWPDSVRLLLGPCYFPFRRALSRMTPPAQRSGLLISLGGADPDGLSLPLVTALRRHMPDIAISLVIGLAFPEAAAKALRQHAGRLDYRLLDRPPGLVEPLSLHRDVITMGGVTMLEAAALGSRAHILSRDPQQAASAAAALDAGYIVSHHLCPNIPMDALARGLAAAITQPSDRPPASLPRDGARRTIQALARDHCA